MQTRQQVAPCSVFDLARRGAWQVTASVAGPGWVIAEAAVRTGGQVWRVGLMPVTAESIALIVWRGDLVVHHARGAEAALCRQAQQWWQELVARADAVPLT